jgi:hypothetical protein
MLVEVVAGWAIVMIATGDLCLRPGKAASSPCAARDENGCSGATCTP